MDYVKSDFDMSVYWKTLNDNGITKERLLSYDRAIHSEPSFRREQKDGLLRDLGHYMRTLKVDSPTLCYQFSCTFVLKTWSNLWSFFTLFRLFIQGQTWSRLYKIAWATKMM